MDLAENSHVDGIFTIGTHATQGICVAVGLGEFRVVLSALRREAAYQDGGCWAEHVA